jgi:hypothetical protein
MGMGTVLGHVENPPPRESGAAEAQAMVSLFNDED